jgi:hypothetical protein
MAAFTFRFAIIPVWRTATRSLKHGLELSKILVASPYYFLWWRFLPSRYEGVYQTSRLAVTLERDLIMLLLRPLMT